MRPQSVTYATSSAYVIVPDTNVSFGPSDLPTRSLHAMLATLRYPFPGTLHCDWWRSVPLALRSGGDRTPRDMARDMPYASGQIGEQPCGVSATSGNPPGVVPLRIYENNRCTLRSWKKPYGYLS
ncbi:hypothetical protein WOLCODRAFT_165070 [Wolfiporia cocos MD-104 SS10]|uniref:Uncharacterized protein n=1 Tax=Wolfiporia cocos (strain MD-104) TaxID=742152 RepID=A0A2H3JQ97_WOLCO|nr:hypothetical protein WOLCODRAFT_165070 [Wolfiporia cocos MD-104 SS10]